MEELKALGDLLDRALKEEAKATQSVVEAIRDELERSRHAVERLLRFKEEVGVQHQVAFDTDVKVEGGRDIWKDTLTAEEFGSLCKRVYFGIDNRQLKTAIATNLITVFLILGIDITFGQEENPEFSYDESKPLDGIIASFTRQCGQNVHDAGIVNVTSSAFFDSRYPKNAVDLETNSSFVSEDAANSWICYDFKDTRVIPTSYSVRSIGGGPGAANLKSWVVEVSNDGEEWTEIDRQDDNTDLNEKHAIKNFEIYLIPSDGIRFFRLRSTGQSHQGGFRIAFTALEIFGTLVEN